MAQAHAAGPEGDEEAVKKDVDRWVEVLGDLGYTVYLPGEDSDRDVLVFRLLGVGWYMAVLAFKGLAVALKGREGMEKTYYQVVRIMMGLWESINMTGAGADAVMSVLAEDL